MATHTRDPMTPRQARDAVKASPALSDALRSIQQRMHVVGSVEKPHVQTRVVPVGEFLFRVRKDFS